MIPYGRQLIDRSDIDAVVDVLKSDYLTTGPKVAEFETRLAKLSGSRYAVASSNGTTALHLAYLALGIGPGDEVIVSPNTFVATTNMLLVLGAKPVFCDIRLDTYNIDETKIERLINKRTRAIVAVHFAGQPCEMNFIWRIAKKYKLLVIEDAAHALGAHYIKKPIGAGKSDAVTFSFHPVKSITTGEGGAVLTNDKETYERLKILRSQGVTKDEKGFNIMTTLGYNYRLTDLQAALGISQLKKLSKFVSTRWKLAARYHKLLAKQSNIILPKITPSTESSWHLYVIRTIKNKDRLPLYKHLLKHGVGANFHYPCVYAHPYYRKHGFKKIHCKNADAYAASTITLPLHPLLTERQQKIVVKLINDYFAKS